MATSFADLTTLLKELNKEVEKGSKGSETFLEKLSGNKAIQGLSRFDTGVGQMLFKFRGMVDTVASVSGKLSGLTKVFGIFQSKEAKAMKQRQKDAGGYKHLIKQYEAMKDAVSSGAIAVSEAQELNEELIKIGVLNSKGKPAGGFFNKIKAFVGKGLKLFTGLLMWGSLIVIGFALLFPLLKDNLPKLKELGPMLKEKFLQLIEIFKPVWEAIKSFVKILFDPNATWMEKVGSYIQLVFTLFKTLALDVLWPALKALWDSLPKIATGLFNNVVWPLVTGLWKVVKDYFKNDFLNHLGIVWEKIQNVANAIVEENAEAVKETTSMYMKVAGGAATGAAGGASLGLFTSAGTLSVPMAIAGGLAGGVIGLGTHIAGRADGGPVMAGRPYMVGERGPELFMPNASGTIIPNGAGNTINVHVNGRLGASDTELRDIARRVGQMVSKEMNRTTSAGMRMT